MPPEMRPSLLAGDWDDEKREKLPGLWARGDTLYEIARQLHLSPNQVIGVVHRLGLEKRGSPIVRDGTPYRRRPPRRPVTLPALSSCEPPAATEVVTRPAPPRAVVTALHAVQPRVEPSAPPPKIEPPKPLGRVVACLWPIGEPGTKTYRSCDAKSEPGRPYCGEHCVIAYVKVRHRHEPLADAAD